MLKVKSFLLGDISTNCYVLYSDSTKNAVVIDIAEKGGEEITNWLTQNGINPIAIMLTHGHFDHCGGVKQFNDKLELPIYIHKADADMCENASKYTIGGIKADDCIATKTFNIEDGMLSVGEFNFRIIHTPGHTPGSVCYIIDEYMFSGDTLFCGCIGRTDFERGNPQDMKKSISKIKNININYKVYPGHDDFTTLDDEKKYNIWLR